MDDGLSFEEALARLEKITQTLEQGGLKLDESLALFEEGVQLARICNERLNSAELKVNQLYTLVDQDEESEG